MYRNQSANNSGAKSNKSEEESEKKGDISIDPSQNRESFINSKTGEQI